MEAGPSCFEKQMICSRNHLAVNVVRGSSSATIVPGQTVLVGTLSFTSGRFEFIFEDGFCDEKSQTVMAAFETAPGGPLPP